MTSIQNPNTWKGAELPDLQAFEKAAQGASQVYVSSDGRQWQVLGTGFTPSQRAVTWVQPDAADAHSAFIAALGQSFSAGIQDAVVRELGLEPAPGKPIAARLVTQGIEMGRTGNVAAQGVDFLTQQSVSARLASSEFLQACQMLGRDAATISPEIRQEIDAKLQERFQNAAANGQSPVPLEQARQWLHQVLRDSVGP